METVVNELLTQLQGKFGNTDAEGGRSVKTCGEVCNKGLMSVTALWTRLLPSMRDSQPVQTGLSH